MGNQSKYETRILEVRCCCDPGKLLGTLPVKALDGLLDRTYVFEFLDTTLLDRESLRPVIKRVQLEVAKFSTYKTMGRALEGDHYEIPFSYDALKDMGVPLEVLRCIEGFKENKNA